MATKVEVELFLSQLRTKVASFGIAYRPREKNSQGLSDLEILPYQREQFINTLTFRNYCSGPNTDSHEKGKPDYFIFGMKMPNGEMAYIKLSLGMLNKPVDCMSFHKAENSLKFPLNE